MIDGEMEEAVPSTPAAAAQSAEPITFGSLKTEELTAPVKVEQKPKPQAKTEEADEDVDLDGEDEEDEHDFNDGDEDEEDDLEEDDSEDADESDEEDVDEDEQSAEGWKGQILKDFTEEGKIRIPVSGKVRELEWNDAKRLLSSGYHTLEKRRETEQGRVELDSHIKEFKSFLSETEEVRKAVEEKNIEGAVLALASLKGLNKLEARRILRTQMIPQVAQFLGLSKEEVNERLQRNSGFIRQYEIQEENEFLKAQPAQKKVEDTGDEVEVAKRAIQTAMIENGLTKSEIKAAHKYLADRQQEVTVESLVNVATKAKAVNISFDAIESVKPSLMKDKKFVDRVVRQYESNPNQTMAQLAQFVRVAAKKAVIAATKSKEMQLAKDVSDKVLKAQGGVPRSNPQRSGRNTPLTFNDIRSNE